MPNPLRDILLGALLTLGILALLLVAARQEDGRMTAAAMAQEARAIEKGAALYATHCSSCHGATGLGIGALGPAFNNAHFFTARLAEVGWSGTLHDYIVNTTTAGRLTATRPLYVGDGTMVMAAWGEAYGGPLRADQIEALAAFVLNWEATATGGFQISPLPTPTPNLAQLAEAGGDALFIEAGCGECHVVEGVSAGDGVSPDLSRIGGAAATRVAGQSADAYLRESILVPNAHVAQGYAKPGACSAILNEAQLDALTAYLLALK